MKNYIPKILLFSVTLLICCALAEIFARFNFEAPKLITVLEEGYTPLSGTGRVETAGTPDAGLYFNTPTGMRLRRNAHIVIKNHNLAQKDIEIRTNSLGFRYGELESTKSDSEWRVLVLGDSVTLGDFVHAKLTYPSVAEKVLRRNTGKSAKVINAGIGSIDLEGEFGVLMDTGIQAKPDVVVVGLYLNDAFTSPNIRVAQRPTYFHYSYLLNELDRRFAKKDASVQHQEHMRNLAPNFDVLREVFKEQHGVSTGDWRRTKTAFNKLVYDSFGDWGYSWTPGFWSNVEQTLTRMQAASLDHNFQLRVVLLPVRYQVEAEFLEDTPQRMFRDLADKLNIESHDFLPTLREAHKAKAGRLYFDHCHMTPMGNEVVGTDLANFLAKH